MIHTIQVTTEELATIIAALRLDAGMEKLFNELDKKSLEDACEGDSIELAKKLENEVLLHIE